jgi:ubiquinone/menaquinone biosynthesis C-methylase UbiE
MPSSAAPGGPTTEAPPPSPELFFATVNAYQRTAALKAAVELDVFSAIAEGKRTASEIASRCGGAERGYRILCDFLVINGFLTKDGKQYRLTRDSAVFLDRKSPAYLGGTLKFLLMPGIADGFKDLAATVRKGGTLLPGEGSVEPENPVWVEFARSMAALTTMPSKAMAEIVQLEPGKRARVLDIAAGHGLFGIAFGRAYPDAEIVALDWAAVLEVARENARAAGIEARFKTIPGSAFEVDYQGPYDVVLLTNFLHHFDHSTCVALLRKVRSALGPGGRAVTLEFVPNDDKVSPASAASFSMMMLGSTAHGDAYTLRELDAMFREAGFGASRLQALPGGFQSVIVTERG